MIPIPPEPDKSTTKRTQVNRVGELRREKMAKQKHESNRATETVRSSSLLAPASK